MPIEIFCLGLQDQNEAEYISVEDEVIYLLSERSDSKRSVKSIIQTTYQNSNILSNVYMEIPANIKQHCLEMYERMLKKYRCNSVNSSALLGACLFYAFKTMRVERSIEEISDRMKVSKKRLNHLLKYVERQENMTDYQGSNVLDLLNRFMNNLSFLSESTIKQMRKRIRSLVSRFEDSLEGKTPKNILCSYIVFLLENDHELRNEDPNILTNYSRKTICGLFNIAPATVSNTVRLIVNESLYF
jgi:transcription initiation factor TFIIIB Brf1 subunit/transcription initiation factor TFIIB